MSFEAAAPLGSLEAKRGAAVLERRHARIRACGKTEPAERQRRDDADRMRDALHQIHDRSRHEADVAQVRQSERHRVLVVVHQIVVPLFDAMAGRFDARAIVGAQQRRRPSPHRKRPVQPMQRSRFDDPRLVRRRCSRVRVGTLGSRRCGERIRCLRFRAETVQFGTTVGGVCRLRPPLRGPSRFRARSAASHVRVPTCSRLLSFVFAQALGPCASERPRSPSGSGEPWDLASAWASAWASLGWSYRRRPWLSARLAEPRPKPSPPCPEHSTWSVVLRRAKRHRPRAILCGYRPCERQSFPGNLHRESGENASVGCFVNLPTAPAASAAACSIAFATSSSCSPPVTTTIGTLTWFTGGRWTRAVLLMMEVGMTTSSPLLFLMVVWRHVISLHHAGRRPHLYVVAGFA